MTARMITVHDIYSFDPNAVVSWEPFIDVVGRHFRQPHEGLGFDNSPGLAHVAHHPPSNKESLRRESKRARGDAV
jgi:hypothetical protein